MPAFITEYPQFFTASIKGWYKLLEHDKYKDIIINSLRFLVEDKRIILYAFAIMSDHIHLTCLPAGRYGRCNHDTSAACTKRFLKIDSPTNQT